MPQRPSHMKPLILRLLVAFLVGFSVFVLSCLAIWRQAPTTLMTNTMIDSWTNQSLRKVDTLIQERIAQGGNPPQSLRELAPLLANEGFYRGGKMIRKGLPVDGWGRPLHYSIHGTSYTLMSYGRDGKPGGIGFDRDCTQNPSSLDFSALIWGNPPMPTLRQFLFELPSRGMIYSCVLSGVIAFLLTTFLVRPAPISWDQAVILFVKISLTMAATIFFAMIIMQLHIPSGH